MSEIPSGWVEAALDEIAEVRLGRQRSPKNHAGPRMRPYLRAANVTWGGLELGDVKQMNFTEAESDTYELRSGNILLAEASGSAGEVGKPAIWRGEVEHCCFQNTLIRVRTQTVEPRYLLSYFLGEARSGRLGGESRGVGIHHIGAQRLSAWRVPVPPLAEQRRIVALIEEQFSRLDTAKALLAAASFRLARLRDSIFDVALTADWPWTTLGEIADVVGGVTKDSKRQQDPSLQEVPYLRVANVQRGFLDLGTISTIRVAPDKLAKFALRPGDVLFNEGGDRDKLGRGWVWSGEIEPCIHQNHVFRARLKADFEPKFISWHGNTFGRKWFEHNGRQTTNLASLNLTTLKRFPVPAPPVDEQRRIVADLERKLSLIQSMEEAIRSAEARGAALRRSVLERAFRGELVPQNPSDEPASVLVERIRAERAAQEKPSRGRRRAGVAPTS